jgi:putative toxin-antitoxin system antitoxin component (TIGR02293 family)
MAANPQRAKPNPFMSSDAPHVIKHSAKGKGKAKVKTGKIQWVLRSHAPRSDRVDLTNLYTAPLTERIEWINKGVSFKVAHFLISKCRVLDKSELLEALELPRATYDRRIKNAEIFPAQESEKILGFGSLIGQVEAMLADNPDANDFDARAWLSKWLTTPLPALGNKKPVDFLNTIAGQNLVSSTLARMAEGVYA